MGAYNECELNVVCGVANLSCLGPLGETTTPFVALGALGCLGYRDEGAKEDRELPQWQRLMEIH